MTNPKYGAIKTHTIPKMNAGLYFGFIGRQYDSTDSRTLHGLSERPTPTLSKSVLPHQRVPTVKHGIVVLKAPDTAERQLKPFICRRFVFDPVNDSRAVLLEQVL